MRQLYIELPYVCAMIYARNDKQNCYTGFFTNIWKTKAFDSHKFMLTHALPGPNSIVHCIIEKDDKGVKKTEKIVYRKDAAVS